MAEFSMSLIEDITIAEQVAYAEKPGRDYLHTNPDLAAEDFFKIAYEIGSASMYTEAELTRPMGEHEYYRSISYEYKAIKPEEPVKFENSALIAEWTQIPGMKLIEGRPVVSREDINDFGNKQVAEGSVTYLKGWGKEVWSVFDTAQNSSAHMVYIQEHPRYELQQTCDRLRYFDAAAAEQAGLEPAKHIDLLSLYMVTKQLPELLEKLPKKMAIDNASFALRPLTPAKVAFMSDFLSTTLGIEEKA